MTKHASGRHQKTATKRAKSPEKVDLHVHASNKALVEALKRLEGPKRRLRIVIKDDNEG